MRLQLILTVIITVFSGSVLLAGNEVKKDSVKSAYSFKDEITLPTTPVKDQYRSGTCWAFSTLSFLESEMLRLGKPEVNLSEMFVVWHAYSEKAWKDVRMHGHLNFSEGGEFHDVINMISKYGIVPEEVYNGLDYGETKPVHAEMEKVLEQSVGAVIDNPNGKLSTSWHEAVDDILDSYLGKLPQEFNYEGKSYSPLGFAKDFVGLNMDDYVEITSFTHHPFYSKFILEIPDNWSWGEAYNVPIDELEEIIDYSLNNGYTVVWAADVSEKGFETTKKGVAVLPALPAENMTDAEIAKWDSLPAKEKESELYQLNTIVPELNVTQEMRQVAFDNYQTTDDHGLHIIGTAKDQEGKTFYKVKNSWGDYNQYDGYFYASKPYVRYKTMSIMVNKNAIPQSIREKLGL